MKRDRDNPEYMDEVLRRWQRRRNLPFRQFGAAWADLKAALWAGLTPPIEWLLSRLNRLHNR